MGYVPDLAISAGCAGLPNGAAYRLELNRFPGLFAVPEPLRTSRGMLVKPPSLALNQPHPVLLSSK